MKIKLEDIISPISLTYSKFLVLYLSIKKPETGDITIKGIINDILYNEILYALPYFIYNQYTNENCVMFDPNNVKNCPINNIFIFLFIIFHQLFNFLIFCWIIIIQNSLILLKIILKIINI